MPFKGNAKTKREISWIPIALLLSIVLLVNLSFAAQHTRDAPSQNSWIIDPREGSSLFNQDTSRRDLADRFGEANLKDEEIGLAEGQTEPGTVLFPADPELKIEILWRDASAKASPKLLVIRGATSKWHSIFGITLGTTLKRTEQINRRPFLLYGFDWDYAGAVVSWRDGILDRELAEGGRVTLRFDNEIQTANLKLARHQVHGERRVSSGHPAMQALNPRVCEIDWQFDER